MNNLQEIISISSKCLLDTLAEAGIVEETFQTHLLDRFELALYRHLVPLQTPIEPTKAPARKLLLDRDGTNTTEPTLLSQIPTVPPSTSIRLKPNCERDSFNATG